MPARCPIVASLILAFVAVGAWSARGEVPRDADVLAQVDRLVRANFYSPEALTERRWGDGVRGARKAFDRASPDRRHQILAALVATLRTSHTEYLAPDDPRHAQLLSIFESTLPGDKDACPDPSKLPPLPIEVSDAGVWWVSINQKAPTAFVLDLRDGWGGAAPEYLRIFHGDVPALQSTTRDGTSYFHDPHIRVPATVLVNRGTRSGKEIIAYAIKKHGLARIVGDNTGGAVLPGRPFCLDDGGILYVASWRLTVDGEVLEGKGVAPDVRVAFDLRHAGGRDPQLEAALDSSRTTK